METINSDLLIISDVSATIPVAVPVEIEVALRCSDPADLEGFSIEAHIGEMVVGSFLLGEYEDGQNVALIKFNAPSTIGEHMLTLSFAGVEEDDIVIEATETAIALQTRAHKTAVSVWGLPLPLDGGETFEITVAAKCIDGCCLAGGTVVIDASGETLATAKLGDTPWEGTQGLYWCEQTMTAPMAEGKHDYKARFLATSDFSAAGLYREDEAGMDEAAEADGVDENLPEQVLIYHEEADFAFSTVTLPKSEHVLTVYVTEKDSGEPVDGADIRAGFFRGVTDSKGIALVKVAKGDFAISAGKPDYDGAHRKLRIDGDVEIELVLTRQLSDEEQDFWI